MGADLLRDSRVAHARHGCKPADQCHPQHEHEAPHQRPASTKQGSTTPAATVGKYGPVQGCSETQASSSLLGRHPLKALSVLAMCSLHVPLSTMSGILGELQAEKLNLLLC